MYVYKKLRLYCTYFHGPDEFLVSGFTVCNFHLHFCSVFQILKRYSCIRQLALLGWLSRLSVAIKEQHEDLQL